MHSFFGFIEVFLTNAGKDAVDIDFRFGIALIAVEKRFIDVIDECVCFATECQIFEMVAKRFTARRQSNDFSIPIGGVIDIVEFVFVELGDFDVHGDFFFEIGCPSDDDLDRFDCLFVVAVFAIVLEQAFCGFFVRCIDVEDLFIGGNCHIVAMELILGDLRHEVIELDLRFFFVFVGRRKVE